MSERQVIKFEAQEGRPRVVPKDGAELFDFDAERKLRLWAKLNENISRHEFPGVDPQIELIIRDLRSNLPKLDKPSKNKSGYASKKVLNFQKKPIQSTTDSGKTAEIVNIDEFFPKPYVSPETIPSAKKRNRLFDKMKSSKSVFGFKPQKVLEFPYHRLDYQVRFGFDQCQIFYLFYEEIPKEETKERQDRRIPEYIADAWELNIWEQEHGEYLDIDPDSEDLIRRSFEDWASDEEAAVYDILDSQ